MCKDIQFMLGFYPNIFWKSCWRFLTPGLMTVIVVYTLWFFELPKDGKAEFSTIAHFVGGCLAMLGLIQVPIFAVYKIYHRTDDTLWGVRIQFNLVYRSTKLTKLQFILFQKIKSAFQPTAAWGPRNAMLNQKYKEILNHLDWCHFSSAMVKNDKSFAQIISLLYCFNIKLWRNKTFNLWTFFYSRFSGCIGNWMKVLKLY